MASTIREAVFKAFEKMGRIVPARQVDFITNEVEIFITEKIADFIASLDNADHRQVMFKFHSDALKELKESKK